MSRLDGWEMMFTFITFWKYASAISFGLFITLVRKTWCHLYFVCDSELSSTDLVHDYNEKEEKENFSDHNVHLLRGRCLHHVTGRGSQNMFSFRINMINQQGQSSLLENHFVTGSVLSVPSVICLWRWSASTSLATPASYLQGNCLRISTHLLPVPLKPVRLICRRPQHILQSYQWCDANLIVLEFKLNIMYCSWYQLVKVEKLLRLWALLGHSGTILEIWETWKSKSNWIRQHSTLRCLIGNLDSKTNLPQGSNQPDSLFLVTRKDFHQKLFSIKILKQKDCHQSPNMTTNSITAITSSPLIKISKMHKALWIFSVAVVVV